MMIKKIARYFNPAAYRSPETALRSWIHNLKDSEQDKGTILITALRNGTWIEWAVYAAFVFKQLGYNSTLLYKKSEVESLYTNPSFWELVSSLPFIRLIDIDAGIADPEILEQYENKKPLFLFDAIAYNHHVERKDIIRDEATYAMEIRALIEDSAKAYTSVNQIAKQNTFHRFICYSGLIQTTPTLLKAGVDAGIETICVEGWSWREGHIIYNFNQPALEYNIKGWMNYYGWGDAQEKTVEEYLLFQNGKKAGNTSWLKSFYNVQQSNIRENVSVEVDAFLEKYPDSFLLAPNVIGDSSTLNRETIFEGIRSWMAEVIVYFKAHPQYSLIIRAHPAEVWAKSKVRIKLGDWAEDLSKGCDNILVIKGENTINTFYLLPKIKCGLVWVSSIGVDLVVRGIPVICAAQPKYSGLDFVQEPDTKEKYFDLIGAYGDGDKIPTTEEERIMAKKYLFVVFTGFSFPAQGKDYSAKTLRLNAMPQQEVHDYFFKVLTGEEKRPDAG
jgi:hypothetical protein